jgi:hypothetical protein
MESGYTRVTSPDPLSLQKIDDRFDKPEKKLEVSLKQVNTTLLLLSG